MTIEVRYIPAVTAGPLQASDCQGPWTEGLLAQAAVAGTLGLHVPVMLAPNLATPPCHNQHQAQVPGLFTPEPCALCRDLSSSLPTFDRNISPKASTCNSAGDRKWAPQKQALKGGLDLVVGTPGRVLSHVQAGTINLQHCHTVVIDEVDVLLGDQHAFSAQVTPCCQACRPSCGVARLPSSL